MTRHILEKVGWERIGSQYSADDFSEAFHEPHGCLAE
jgi:hypothetical protein